ncbi:MAG: hypothetical protein IKY98_05195 [Alphaproteobacteria bacterium]|nr:hypothetical protein [Alphaproteobacteria bacterium]
MHKILIMICAVLMIPSLSNACGGISIKGNSGTSYCLSKHTMNWYSAYAWCDAQEMALIDLTSVCESSTGCSELNLSSDEKDHIENNGGTLDPVWTDTSGSKGHAQAYVVALNGGYLFGFYGRTVYSQPALCK